MPRPSQRIDEALLRSGRALYPQLGCAGLTQRRLAEHAGVSPGMFHYHFKSKDEFLRTLLLQLYDEMFRRLSADAAVNGPALPRLRQALIGMARFVREYRPMIVRLVLDAMQGVPVARQFVRANAPRHFQVMTTLLEQAQAENALPPAPGTLQRTALLLGAVIAPMVIVPGMARLGLPLARPVIEADVTGDEAIAERVDLALTALQALRRPKP